MRNRNGFLELITQRFARARRITAVHPPKIPPLPKTGRRESGPAWDSWSESRLQAARGAKHAKAGAPTIREQDSFWSRGIRAALSVVFLLVALSTHAAVREVGTIGITVDNLDRELNFFTNTLPFQLVSISQTGGPDTDQLLGLHDSHLRVAELKLGGEHLTLTEHLTHKGRAIPTDSQSFDHWFQHIAIVVRDMDPAYEQLRQHKVKHVSTAPQTLPAWNTNAAGIKAFYFRDPEDHVLEIIFFPPGKGDPKWQAPGTNIFLGIDHTAIVVSDTDKSLEFYHGLLGLRIAGESENYGVEQEHLNQVFGARLRITGLRAEHGPGIEFLEYVTPPGGRPLPIDAGANDLVFWHTHLTLDDPSALIMPLHEHGVRFVSSPSINPRSQIVRDPDGHALQFDGPMPVTTASQK